MKTEWSAYGVAGDGVQFAVFSIKGAFIVQFAVVCYLEIYFILGLSLMLMDATTTEVFHFCVIIVSHEFDPIYTNERN